MSNLENARYSDPTTIQYADVGNTRRTTALFLNKDAAERAYQRALDVGYTPKDINVFMSETSRLKYYGTTVVLEKGDKSMDGLGLGGATGGAVGGILAAIAALGTSIAIPGLGIVVAGPLVAGLAGAGAGSIAGGLIGTLIGWGVSEERVHELKSGIQEGGIVLSVDETLPETHLQEDWHDINNTYVTKEYL